MEEHLVDGWRWSNVPVPEPHVVGLLLGLALHSVRPRRADRLPGRTLVGIGSIGSSLLVIGWCVRTAGGSEIDAPTAIISSGPYAHSRNPMYLAWTVLYAGVSLVVNSMWPLRLLPLVVLTMHASVRQEERALEQEFGDVYRAYCSTVPRYV